LCSAAEAKNPQGIIDVLRFLSTKNRADGTIAQDALLELSRLVPTCDEDEEFRSDFF